MNFTPQLLVPVILFLITSGFGFWVSQLGRPYNNLLFNIHKLIALSGVVLTVIKIIELNPHTVFTRNMFYLFGLTAVIVIGLFATGAIMSIRQEESRAVLSIHQIALVLVLILAGWLIFLWK